MDSVMRNPQLLEEIFDTGYDGEHVLAYALVCKAWSDPALNLLWKVVTPPKLLWLFGILSPLKRVKTNTEAGRRAEQVFTLERDPTLEDWQRFQYYSRRVKVLEYMESDTHSSMDQSALDSLALIRSQGPIFPNLRIFFVDISLPNAVMFLHSGIRQLYIVILTDQDPENDRDFLDHVSLRVPDLTILWISMQHSSLVANVIQQLCPILPYEEEVVQILSQQTRLQQLNLPKFWATTKVVNAVSHLDSLQSILVMKPSYPGHPLESVNFSPFSSLNTRKLALPALQRLMLTVPYTAFHSFLQRWVTPHLQFFSALHELKLQSQLLESSETLKEVIRCISIGCPGMSTLSITSVCRASISSSDPLNCGFGGGLVRTTAPPPEGWSLKTLLPFRVNLATISPLFKLTQLRQLDLHHNLPAAFTFSDLETIATNFRQLTRLDLFSDPCSVIRSTSPKVLLDEVITNPKDYVEKCIFDLRIPLRMFGSLCPELHSLGLFLCADANLTEQQSDTLYSYSPSNDQPIGQEIGSSIPQLFPNLQSLNFGTSPILHSEATLAGILCQYIGGDVRISSGPSRNISNSTPNTYIGRLGLGGKVPDPIPDHLNDKNEGADKRAKLWSLDANGEPLVDDYAVVVGENGEPLSLGLEFMTPDEFGVKRFPGVFIMRERSKIRSKLHAESTKWGKVAKMLSLAARISEQERRRVERLDC